MIKIQNSRAKMRGKIKFGGTGGSGGDNNPQYLYFYPWRPVGFNDPDAGKWWNLNSWYTDVNFSIPATELPGANTIAIVLYGSYIDLDHPTWVQPKSITLFGPDGITVITSQLSANISCNIEINNYGGGPACLWFEGNATFNK